MSKVKIQPLNKLYTVLCLAALFALCLPVHAAEAPPDNVRVLYETYQARLDAIKTKSGISESGFDIVESQIFPFEPEIKPEPATEPGTDSC